jgi:hypothetical protein
LQTRICRHRFRVVLFKKCMCLIETEYLDSACLFRERGNPAGGSLVVSMGFLDVLEIIADNLLVANGPGQFLGYPGREYEKG